MVSFTVTQFNPNFDQQKFWDFWVDNEWYSQSVFLSDEIFLEPKDNGFFSDIWTPLKPCFLDWSGASSMFFTREFARSFPSGTRQITPIMEFRLQKAENLS